MSTTQNKKLLTHIFERMAVGDTTAFRDAMSAEFRWTLSGTGSWSGLWEPKHVVLDQLTRPLMAQFESYRCEADEILADGERVVVRAHSTATTKRGHAYDQDYCFIFGVREGKLTEVVEYCDSSLVELALYAPVGNPGERVARR